MSLAFILYWWFYVAQVYNTDSKMAVILEKSNSVRKMSCGSFIHSAI